MHIDYTTEQRKLQPKLAPANINPESFLATDYLNHFNEIVMLMEMIPDMPELVEEAIEWAPKSYPQHFTDSGFQAKDLAIEAYEKAPPVFREPFEETCHEMDKLIQETVQGLVRVNVVERGMSGAAQEMIRARIATLQDLLMKLNQVIHGKVAEEESKDVAEAHQEEVQSQEEIDKLFD